jgi:hypothetical protein
VNAKPMSVHCIGKQIERRATSISAASLSRKRTNSESRYRVPHVVLRG